MQHSFQLSEMVPELKQEMKHLLSQESESSTHTVKKTNPKGGKKPLSINSQGKISVD